MNEKEQKKADYLVILEEVLLAAKQNGLVAASDHGEFSKGNAFAYADVLSVAIEQADLLGVPLSALGLDGFDPDRKLLHVVTKSAA
jgi:hypothetical protein